MLDRTYGAQRSIVGTRNREHAAEVDVGLRDGRVAVRRRGVAPHHPQSQKSLSLWSHLSTVLVSSSRLMLWFLEVLIMRQIPPPHPPFILIFF